MGEKIILREAREKGIFLGRDFTLDLKKKTIRISDRFVSDIVRKTIEGVMEALKR